MNNHRTNLVLTSLGRQPEQVQDVNPEGSRYEEQDAKHNFDCLCRITFPLGPMLLAIPAWAKRTSTKR